MDSRDSSVVSAVGDIVVFRQDLSKIPGQFFRAGVVQVQAGIIGIHLEIQTDLFGAFCKILVGQAVIFGILCHLGIVFLIPVRVQAGRLHQNQLHALFPA